MYFWSVLSEKALSLDLTWKTNDVNKTHSKLISFVFKMFNLYCGFVIGEH